MAQRKAKVLASLMAARNLPRTLTDNEPCDVLCSTPGRCAAAARTLAKARSTLPGISHPVSDGLGIAGLEVAVTRQRLQREDRGIAVIAQVEHARETDGGEPG